MNWAILAILASFFWALSNVFDKFLLSKLVRKPIFPLIMIGLASLITGILVILFKGIGPLAAVPLLLAILSGALYTLMAWFYFKSLQVEEVSRVVPLFYITPLFVLILATCFLGEVFIPIKYLAIFLLILGAIMLSMRKTLKIKFGKAFFLMMLSCLSISASQILLKYLLGLSDFWTVFAYVRFGVFISTIPLWLLYSKDFRDIVVKTRWKAVYISGLSESVNIIAVFCNALALTTGFVTLVNSLSSLQSFFLLAIMIFLSLFYPKILREEIDKKTVAIKIVAIALLFIGSILLSL